MLSLFPAALAKVSDPPAGAFEMEHPRRRRHSARPAVEAASAAANSDHPDPHRIEEAPLLAIHGTSGRSERLASGTSPSPSPSVARMLDRTEAEAKGAAFPRRPCSNRRAEGFQMLRRFAQVVGTTPHGSLTRHRVKLARRAIAAGSPWADAAVASGFADRSSRTRAFARRIGMCPGRYRSGRGV